MSYNTKATIDICGIECEVNIEFIVTTPGASPTWGSDGGDPGWPPEAELLSVMVTKYDGLGRDILSHQQCRILDNMAWNRVLENWESEFAAMCLEDKEIY